ncbi:hypothetical protein Bbelb_103920 [Branchiostoma belcheri]|nr:hypothetical protein Bbelb_103920 [Branchiostoma belcheri]
MISDEDDYPVFFLRDSGETPSYTCPQGRRCLLPKADPLQAPGSWGCYGARLWPPGHADTSCIVPDQTRRARELFDCPSLRDLVASFLPHVHVRFCWLTYDLLKTPVSFKPLPALMRSRAGFRQHTATIQGRFSVHLRGGGMEECNCGSLPGNIT